MQAFQLPDQSTKGHIVVFLLQRTAHNNFLAIPYAQVIVYMDLNLDDYLHWI